MPTASYFREYRKRNLGKFRDYEKDRNRRRVKLTPEQRRIKKLRIHYGLSLEQYEVLIIGQNFRCAICGKHQSEVGKTFCVDHDHACCPGDKSCGKCIRGLLCRKCNLSIGLLEDDPILLEQAANYLRAGR